MNYLINITAACLLTILSVTSYAESLNTAIKKEVASGVNLLNLESKKYFVRDPYYPEDEAMTYAFNTQKIVMKDVNSDGIQDAVALLYYCEDTNCHTTTKSAELVVFKGLGKNQFTKIGSAFLGISAEIKNIKNGVISVTSYGYGDNDPSCCPTDKITLSYKIKNGKLVKAS